MPKLSKLRAIYEKHQNDIYMVLRPHKQFNGVLTLGDTKVTIGVGTELDLTGSITIKNYCEISENVKIFTHKHLWNHSRGLRGKIQKVKPIDLVIGNDVFIGTDAMIIGINSIGDGAIIGARAVITKDVPAYEIWAGNPAKKIGERKDE